MARSPGLMVMDEPAFLPCTRRILGAQVTVDEASGLSSPAPPKVALSIDSFLAKRQQLGAGEWWL